MQQQKTGMGKRKFRIGDLARELKVKKYVVRFWEKEFELESDRSEGGQRFYTKEDLKLFSLIKDLLYNRGFTISGAKKELAVKSDGKNVSIPNSEKHIVAATKDAVQKEKIEEHAIAKNFLNELEKLKKDLKSLKDLL